MNKPSVFIVAACVSMLLLSSLASAGFWPNAFHSNKLTANLAFEVPKEIIKTPISKITPPASTVNQQVKCTFLDSDGPASCSAKTSTAPFGKCEGTKQLQSPASPKETPKQMLVCGYAANIVKGTPLTIEGCSKAVKFVANGEPISVVFDCKSTNPPTQTVTEEDQCLFENAIGDVSCTSEGFGGCGISAKDRTIGSNSKSCTVKVTGAKGTFVGWNSPCGAGIKTLVDGLPEVVKFDCAKSVPIVTDEVKCVFDNARSDVKCYNDANQGGCAVTTKSGTIPSSTVTCISKVSGPKGSSLTWKSSCGGYQTTTYDGTSKIIRFTCSEAPNKICTPGALRLTQCTGACPPGAKCQATDCFGAEKCIDGMSWVKVI